MNDRAQKIREMMHGFHAMRRKMLFKAHTHGSAPRITPSQWGVLMCLGHHDASVKELAETLNVSSSAATQLTDGLVKNGYLERKENSEDRRKVVLSLSAKTKKHIEKMHEQGIRRFLTLFETLNDKEFNEYMRLNKKIFGKFSDKNI